MDNLIPLSLLSGMVLYLIRLGIERSSIQTALLIDMNLIIKRAHETKEYLDRNDHYWLISDTTLSHSPSDVQIKNRIFDSLLSKMYLLGKGDLNKVLTFYSHYQQCEALKKSLFKRIAGHVKSANPVSEKEVHLLNLRRNRISNALASLIGGNKDGIKKLRLLPTTYTIASTSDISREVNHSIASTALKSAIIVFNQPKEK